MSREIKSKEFATQWKTLKDKFEKSQKKVKKYETRSLDDKDRKIGYKNELVEEFNKIIVWIASNIDGFSEQSQEKLLDKIDKISDVLEVRLKTLGFRIVFPEDRLHLLNENSVSELEESERTEINEIDDSLEFDEDDVSDSLKSKVNNTEKVGENSGTSDVTNNSLPIVHLSVNNNSQIMVLSALEFLNLCARHINNSYGGEPGGLTPFLNTIKLLRSTYEGRTHDEALINFLMTKLTGKALNCVAAEPASVDEIVTSLRNYIKPEGSKSIVGKMLALRADRNNFTDYVKRTEELADSFKQALILEGIPHENANRMTIDKTIELCRSNTTSSTVKSILASTPFEQARDVVAKFVIESRTDTNEHKVLQFQSNHRYSNSRGFQRNNFNRNNRSYGQNHNNHSYNNNSNNRNFRGRGNNNGNNFRNNNNNRGGSNRHHNNGNNNGRQNARVYYTENGSAPPPGAGASDNVNVAQADQ